MGACTGEMGDPGPQGEQGEMGEMGSQGEQGSQGPTGIVTLLSFDAPQPGGLAFNSISNLPSVPAPCHTATGYTAGANETAVIHVDGSISPFVATNGFFFIAAAVSTTGPTGTYTAVSTQSFESIGSDGAASPSVSAVYALTDGTTYHFASQFETSLAMSINLGKSACHGVIEIVRQ